MTFEEWWDDYWTKTSQPAAFDATFKEVAGKAWDAATAAERERCARVAEGMEQPDGMSWNKASLYGLMRREAAAEIRRKP